MSEALRYKSFLASAVECGTEEPNHQQNPGRPVVIDWNVHPLYSTSFFVMWIVSQG